MKAPTLLMCAVAFVVPVGLVLAMNLSDDSASQPPSGTLHYFYSPG